MYYNRVNWISVDTETPDSQRPVTAVVSKYKGAHTAGVYYKDGKWFDMRSDEELNERVVCWVDLQLPQEILFKK